MSKHCLFTRVVSGFILISLLFPFSSIPSVQSRPATLQDASPPWPVGSLNASPGAAPGSVELSWIAPGDDATTGRAAAYVVRYNTVPIVQDEDEDTWTSAMEVDGEPAPGLAGTLESMTVSGLEVGKSYTFALKSEDDEGNLSEVSNNSSVTSQSWPNSVHLPLVIRSYDLAPVIPDTTVVLPDTTTQYLEALSEDMTFTFSQWTPELEALDPGDIMVGDVAAAAPHGFLRRVQSIETLCDKVVVNTDFASLNEAVETGEFQVSQMVTPDQVRVAQLADGVSMAAAPDGLGFEFQLTDYVLYDDDGNMRTENDQITADGSIALDLGLDIGAKIRFFGLKEFHAIARADEQIEVSVDWGVSLTLEDEKLITNDLGKFIPSIKALIGPVPVVIEPVISLSLKYEGEISVGVSTGMTQHATVKLGVAYEDGHWDGVHDFDNQFQFDPPHLEVSGKVRAGLYPEIALMLYGMAGPYFGVYVYTQLEGVISGEGIGMAPEDLEISLYAGLELISGARISIDILDRNVFKQEYEAPALNFQFTLARWTFFDNKPPNSPSSPMPPDDSPDQPRNPLLLWTGGDPDGDELIYDLYLEANDPYPDVLIDSVLNPRYDPGMLAANTDYYWRVVATDSSGATSAGLVWSFRTGESVNQPPIVPWSPTPADGDLNQLIYQDLKWFGDDLDGDAVTYDVYLEAGNSVPSVLLCDDAETEICYSGALTTTQTYYWQVVAQDEHGRSSPGDVWSFTTGTSTNLPPDVPQLSSPYDGNPEVSLKPSVHWIGWDPDSTALTFDVYLEAEDGTPDVLVCDDVPEMEVNFCYPGILQGNTKYYWQVVARDGEGATTNSPVWMFTTVDMIYIPAGDFQMGCDECNLAEQCLFEDELPLHTVSLSDYAIDRTAVTNAEYAECVSFDYCDPPLYNSSRTHASYYDNPEFADYPVLWVDHANAQWYCSYHRGGALPTEAQWEKAARGSGEAIVYPWGNPEPVCSLANFIIWNGSDYEPCVGDTSMVGAYAAGASPYGALDMGGNVWEWVGDWYGSDYYSQPENGVNPSGPLSGTLNVMRGGSWLDYWYELRVANRSTMEPTAELDILGFRCVQEFGE